MKKKYELTDETLEWCGHTLHQIKALKYFGNVKKGDMGGFVEKEDNLSQNNDCWVYDNAKVFGNANVSYDAQVYGNAEVCDNAEVYGNAKVFDKATVYGNARVFGNAQVFDKATVYGNATIFENAFVSDNAEVYGNAGVCGNAEVCGDAEICGNAEIKSIRDYAVFKNFWSSGRCFTWTRSNDMWRVGCFYGTGDELIKKAYLDSEESGRNYKAYVKLVKELNTPKESFMQKFMKFLAV